MSDLDRCFPPAIIISGDFFLSFLAVRVTFL